MSGQCICACVDSRWDTGLIRAELLTGKQRSTYHHWFRENAEVRGHIWPNPAKTMYVNIGYGFTSPSRRRQTLPRLVFEDLSTWAHDRLKLSVPCKFDNVQENIVIPQAPQSGLTALSSQESLRTTRWILDKNNTVGGTSARTSRDEVPIAPGWRQHLISINIFRQNTSGKNCGCVFLQIV